MHLILHLLDPLGEGHIQSSFILEVHINHAHGTYVGFRNSLMVLIFQRNLILTLKSSPMKLKSPINNIQCLINTDLNVLKLICSQFQSWCSSYHYRFFFLMSFMGLAGKYHFSAQTGYGKYHNKMNDSILMKTTVWPPF